MTMSKKEYDSPVVECITVETNGIVCGSGDRDFSEDEGEAE